MSNYDVIKPAIIGWDIGGAQLKAVLLDAQGNFINSIQLACPLWRGLNYLETAFKDTLQAFNIKPLTVEHAITMTGELVDLFVNRHDGVCQIAKTAIENLCCTKDFERTTNTTQQCRFYAANIGFVTLNQVSQYSRLIASTNWHASASLLASVINNALLIDIGSTTTDLIPIVSRKLSADYLKTQADYLSDAARLKLDTLLYTGVVRTPVMALAQKLPFEQGESNVAAELFATTADVYRLTSELNAQYDVAETADGKGKSQLESARRLARMIGHDLDNENSLENEGNLEIKKNPALEKWRTLAFDCRVLHITQIKTAVLKHLKADMTIIGAGSGSFLAQSIAADLQYPYLSVAQALPEFKAAHQQNIEVCLPAYAVARLSLLNSSLSSNIKQPDNACA